MFNFLATLNSLKEGLISVVLRKPDVKNNKILNREIGFLFPRSSNFLRFIPVIFICAVSIGYWFFYYNTTYYWYWLELSGSSVSFINQIMWFSGVFLSSVVFFLTDTRFTRNKVYRTLCLLFPFIVIGFLSTTNLLQLFMYYELFLLPSFLLVLVNSPNRRGVIASLYFLIWTQIGSFLVLIGILFVYANTKFLDFTFISLQEHFSSIYWFFFIGFGIKIPVWPMHYWLTKTHVEAPTYFSIYLSGFLVKTAVYGLWVCGAMFVTVKSLYIAIWLGVIGVIDSSVKMWAQVDLKKLVAYGTVQEMNIILIGVIYNTYTMMYGVMLFIIAHTVLSTLFFGISDMLYKRFNSRTTSNLSGLIHTHPLLAWIILFGVIFYAGLPFTIKFSAEIYIYNQLYKTSNLLLLFVLFFCNWIGIIGFAKNWFNVAFGTPQTRLLQDSTYRDVYLCVFLLTIFIPFNLITFFL